MSLICVAVYHGHGRVADLLRRHREGLDVFEATLLGETRAVEALLQEQLPDLQAQVDYIENVEAGSVITPARGAKVAPTSKQFSLLIAVILGLIVGVLAAIISSVIWPVRPVIDRDSTS